MRELGIDISKQRSKSVDEFADEPFDIVVTTCDEAKEACPLFPGAKRMIHWGIPDPAAVDGDAERRTEAFRQARDMIKARLSEVTSEAAR